MKLLFRYHVEELASGCNLNVICEQPDAQKIVSVSMRKKSLCRYNFLQNPSLNSRPQKNNNSCRKYLEISSTA